MLVEIITIGDEILIGQIVDTNSAWIAQQLNLIGFKVKQITSVSDDAEHIKEALQLAEKRADVILITGGLGPTKDDVTKKTLAEFFGAFLIRNTEVENHVIRFFRERGREPGDINLQQADVPENCTVIENKVGTAPGMWFEKNKKVYISMPGVPYEMMEMMQKHILPALKEKFDAPTIYHRTLLTQGVGESQLAQWIASWENALPSHIKLAYLPSPGIVRLRISAMGNDKHIVKTEVDAQIEKLREIIGRNIFGEGEQTLAGVIQELMIQKNLKLALGESCTGGFVAHLITSVPGSSAYFQGGVIPYQNEMKTFWLGVHEETLRQYGAVSEQVVREMAQGLKQLFQADYSIAISGIAGPGGATPDKPVGLVWVAVGTPGETIVRKLQFGNNRLRNIQMTSLSALNLLRKIVLGLTTE
ncbi:MAG: competence/damage-inducible protein A [Flavobacteriales bacterium]